MPSKNHSLSILLAAVAVTGACAGKSPRAAQTAPQPPVTVAPPPAVATMPAVDPVTQLLADADKLFASGQQELALGHLERAKSEFNRALSVLLESSQGARSDARIREHFDRLLDRISALELNALATGDGFTEQRSEPASIDELLKLETLDAPNATAATTTNAATTDVTAPVVSPDAVASCPAVTPPPCCTIVRHWRSVGLMPSRSAARASSAASALTAARYWPITSCTSSFLDVPCAIIS